MYRLLTQQASVWLFQRKKEKGLLKLWPIFTFWPNVWGCLRCTGVLCICGAFFACVEGVADVIWNGHGQNIGWLLRHLLHGARVPPFICDPIDVEAEATRDGLAAFTEQPELEALLVICGDFYNVRHLQFCYFLTVESFWVFYRLFQAIPAGVPSHQRKSICLSSCYWWSE